MNKHITIFWGGIMLLYSIFIFSKDPYYSFFCISVALIIFSPLLIKNKKILNIVSVILLILSIVFGYLSYQ